jgi:hypothetical protein
MKRLIKIYTIFTSLLLLSACQEKEEEDLMDLERMATYEEEESIILPVDDQPFIVDSTAEGQELLIDERPAAVR